MKIKMGFKSLLFPIFFFLLLCLPDILYFAMVKDLFNLFYGLIFTSSLFLVPLYLFKNKLRIYAMLVAVFILLMPIAIFTICYFKVRINEDMLSVIYNTNYHEVRELISGYIPLIILVLIINILLIILIIKKLPVKISHTLALRISIISLLLVLGAPVLKVRSSPYPEMLNKSIIYYYPMYIVRAEYKFNLDQRNVKDFPLHVKNFYFNAIKKDHLLKRQIYVLIIGESSRYDHWGINGYSRPTSPLISREKKIISFKNVCTGGGLTEFAVPMLITGVTPTTYKQHLFCKSIVSLFKEAEFKTYWITNQTNNGNITMHAKESDKVVMTETFYNAIEMVHYDMELVDSLQSLLSRDTRNSFSVLHTLGSHFNYTYRYPAQYDIFQPTGWHTLMQPTDISNKEKMINGYDNSTLYTDAVIDSVIHVVDRLNAVGYVLYISDHGENLFDDERKLSIHTANKPTRYINHIPLFIYTNAIYDSIYPLKVKALEEHINNKISSDNIFFTLADMSDISFNGEDSSKSIANKNFEDNPQLIYGGDGKIYNCRQLK